MKFNKIKKFLAGVLSLAMLVSSVPATGMSTVKAAEETGTLTSVESVTADGNVVTVTFNDDIQGRITLLEDGIFRYNVDPSGEFSEYAAPRASDNDPNKVVARIQQYPDTSDNYSKPTAEVTKDGDSWVISSGDTKIVFDADAKMTIMAGDKVVMEEQTSLKVEKATVQTLEGQDGEQFFGGGTQNGRFVHTGKAINIANESSWNDGGVASPSPFYYSTAGYGVLRNTFQSGKYDFGAAYDGVITATHNEKEFDAYYFVSDEENSAAVTQELLQGYFHVTGNPVLLPAYGFYLGHLNAYNRDMWSNEGERGGWEVKGNGAYNEPGTKTWEKGGTGTTLQPNTHAESLNGHGPEILGDNIPEGVDFPWEFSAQARLEQYLKYDMPIGFFLPNDGYGAGYGTNGYQMTDDASENRLKAVEANLANLQEFAEYAKSKGVETGLWAQSNLTPDAAKKGEQWQLLRDFTGEVKAGVTTLKTDVAWVGYGYDFQLNGVKQAYDIATTVEYADGKANVRPNIISLDGWAGSQRYNSVWTGDQTGGKWEYIRFHIPTFIGQSLSGNPNIGCDMDGIWGGNPVIATRDYQWKSFAPQMLDMDGWGSYQKGPYVHGDPFTGISRMYLKLKAMMMPYIYTNAYAAANIDTGNGDQGLPMVRAMFLEFPEEAEAYGELAKYQYMWGENLLVAPLYQNTNADEMGNDVRDGIYLPGGEDQIWLDYFTGEQYNGGQVLNSFDAPIWKLPLFVKNGAIIPMFAEHNVATPGVENGVDKTQRFVEFWPAGNTEFNTIEDDGFYIESKLDKSDKAYGTMNDVSYGDHVETLYTSEVNGTTATLTANVSEGTYPGYDQNKDTTFIVNTTKEPTALTAKNGETALTEVKVDSKEAFEAAEAAEGTFVSFYDAEPAVETFASAEEVKLAEMVADVKGTGKLYVKFANTDSQANAQTLVVEGFAGAAAAAVENPFVDVAADRYDFDAVLWAYANGVTDGVDATHFAPDATATRAEVVTFLWRVYGSEAAAISETGFVDVEAGSFYENAVLWAVENKITSGKTETEFAPNDVVTRAEFVSFLHRAEGEPEYTVENPFVDVADDKATYYYDAVLWAVENGVTKGADETHFNPNSECTRGQVVTFLYRASGETVNAGDKLDENLAAPVLSADEEAATPTSLTLLWDAVEGADSYQIEADGSAVLYTVMNGNTTFTHTGLKFKSEHTYRIRSVGANGYSVWSEPITAFSADDPFVNTPVAKNVTWDGGYYSNNYAVNAFDHIFQQGDSGFHSNQGVTDKWLTVDYGNAYLFDKIEYYHRAGNGNGTVKTMHVETSLDGINWVAQAENFKFAEMSEVNDDMKLMDLSDPATGADYIGARFIRFQVVESRGDYFHAHEIKPCTITENIPGNAAKPFRVGNLSTMGMEEATLTTFQQMFQKESSAHGSVKNPKWVGEIQAVYADINFNGVSDIYDYAFTAFEADGGTKQLGSVRGNVKLVPSAVEIAAGETFTINVTAENVKNMNAYGSVMNYDPAKVEFVGAEYGDVANMYTQGMTGNIVYDDGTAYVNHNAINVGNKVLVNGSKVLSTVTMRAKQDITLNDITDIADPNFVMDLSTVTIMGPDYSYVECTGEVDDNQPINFGLNDFNITMTNEFLPEDDGTNVTKLIQQGKYDGLFNGAAGREFEFKWDIESNYDEHGALPEYVTLPLTMHLDLKEDALIDVVNVYNANKGNGYLTSAEAQLVYADGTKSEMITISDEQAVYEFAFTPEKLVDGVEITFLSSTPKMCMLTLAEIEVIGREYKEPEEEVIDFGLTDLDITMTNEFLPEDDGTNVAKLVQQESYEPLFNGSTGRDFELKWDWEGNYDDTGKLPEYVTLPLTMHFDLKEDAMVDNVTVYNANKGNGYLTSAKAQLVYTDGTTSDEIVIDTESAVYSFDFAPEKTVDRVDVTFLTAAPKMCMLTLAEITMTGRAAK